MRKLGALFLIISPMWLICSLAFSDPIATTNQESDDCKVLNKVSLKLYQQANEALRINDLALLVKLNDSLQLLNKYDQSCVWLKNNANQLNAFILKRNITNNDETKIKNGPGTSVSGVSPIVVTNSWKIKTGPSSNPRGAEVDDFFTNSGSGFNKDILRKNTLGTSTINSVEKNNKK